MAIAPAVAAGLSVALGVGQMALGVAGSVIGAASEAEAARQAEEIATKNKEIAEGNAQRTLILAQEEQFDVDMETQALLGEQEAVQAGSGLRLDSGSFIQTRSAARQLGRIDALNVQEAAKIRAEAYRTEGDSYAAEAMAARRAGGNAILGGFLGAAGSVIGGAGNMLRISPTRTNGRMTVPAGYEALMKVPTNTTPRTQRASGDRPFIQNRGSAGASSQAALGNQLVQLGNQMGSTGGLLDQQATQARRFGVMQNFSALSATVDERLTELKRNADPAQGNFADTATAEYSNWEADWLATVPEEFYDEFATRAADIKASVARDSLAFQYERTDEFFRQGVADQYDAALIDLDQDGSAENLAAVRANLDEFINSTGLTEAEKTSLRRNVYKGIESVSYKAEVRRGNIEVGALGVGSASGTAADLILDFDGTSLENGLDYETNRELVDERVKEAEQTAVAAIGDIDRWAAMPSRVRGALISLVDDLGELPDTVQQAIASGDLEAVAQAVADLSGTEGDRRQAEAEIILGLRDMPEGQLDADPRYANIPYEDRLALRADAEREAAAQQTADQEAALRVQKAAINTLEVGLMDGRVGQYEIDQAREQGWLTQASDIKRLQSILDDQTEALVGVQQIQSMISSGMTGNPADEDFRKAFNTFVGPQGEQAMRQRDESYIANVLVPAVRTLGDLPTDSVGLLTGMMRGQDQNQALFALDVLSQLEQASPEAYNARVTEEVAADVAYWQSAKDYYPADQVLAAVRGGTTQEERTRVTMLREEARKLINDGTIKTTAVEGYIAGLRGTMGDAAGWRNGDPIMAAGLEQAMTADYIQLFEREYARDGDEGKAQERATAALGRVWQVTDVGGQQQLMKYPPERVGYQPWNGSYDWITEQGRADLGLKESTPFQLISDEQTRSEYQEWAAGKPGAPRPSYLAVYKDANGNLKMPTEKRPGAGGELFDTGTPMRLFFEVTPEMEAVKAENFQRENEELAREQVINTFNQAQRHSLHTGVPIPPEIQQAYDDAVAEGGVPRNTSLVFQKLGPVMPLRAQQLDTGFTAYQSAPVEAAPERERQGGLFDIVGNWADMQGDLETIGAAFRMENDIVNTVSLMSRPVYEPDPTFDTAARLKADGLWNDYSDNFLGVESEAEYLAVSSRIAQEEKDRKTLAAAGSAGFIAQMAAGLISPTALIPFVGGARGVKALGAGVALGFAGGVAQELPLQLAQETRTLQESVSSIAMSTVLTGVLGGAIGFMRRPVDDLADIMVGTDMAAAPGAIAIPKPRSAGAASRLEEAPELASAFGMENTVGRISPVVRVLTSRYGQARYMMAQLADAGLEFAGKTPAAIGGNVESRIKTYYGPVDRVMRSFDEAFARYWFADGAKKPFAVKRAQIAGMNPNRVKMSRKEFKEEVARALQNGDQHEVAEVREVAGLLRKEIYDPIFKKAQAAGLYRSVDGVSETPGDVSYLNRVYNQDLIQMRQPEFEQILAAHYERKLIDDFRESFARLNEQGARAAERAEDFRRTPDEVKTLREQFEQQLKELDEGRDAELVELEDAISDKRSAARAFDRGTPEREAATAEARSLEQEGGEALAQTRAARAVIRRRLANLRRAHSALTERQNAKLDKIARAEDLSFGTLQRLVRRGQKVLDELDNVSDEKLAAELSKLKNQFAAAAVRYDRNEDRIAKVFDDEFEADIPTSPFVQAAKIESASFDKMTDVAEAIEQVEVYDRVIARQAIQAGLDDAIMRAQSIVERRAVRNSRLAEQAKQLDPDAAAKRIGQIEEDVGLRRREFLDQWRERGADDIDPVTGVSNFKRFASEMARTTTNKILGTHMRLPGMDIILEPRGAELARVLDIDSNLLRSGVDGKSFLEMDAEKLTMMYVRTLAPDIELSRALGEFAPDFGRNEQFIKLDDEYNTVLANDLEQMKAGVNPATGKPRTYTQEQMDKHAADLADDYKAQRRDLEAVIGRMRHTWGVPKDPRGFGARAARIASNVNVLRFMNMVTVSSIPDIGRPIMKYGLLRTFRDGYVPFLKSLAEMKFTPRQLRQMGAALDVTLHSRAAQVYDVGDYMVRGSKFEKGLDYATSKIGLIAVFDYWTAAMKQISGSVINARAMGAIEIVAGGVPSSAKDLDEAVKFLAQNGIDDDYALRIWKQLQDGGGEKVGGQWWPNTEDWIDDEARTAYNAMLVREIDNTIITPGVERPLMADVNPFMRLLLQFKSFGMSSTTKTFLAGAQGMRQGDMAFVTGGIISLALGTLSYYTYANIAGGEIKARMEAALAKGEWEVFADEAINRSGLLGIGADIQSAFAATPLAPYATFSGERSTRRGGDNLWETIAGPTVGDLGPRAANIAAGLGGTIADRDASQMAWGDLRRIAPLQNHFLLRKFYDMIEEAAP